MRIGIIGGSGLDDPKIINRPREKKVLTRWGSPSSSITLGKIKDVDVAVLARHGKKHSIAPTKINFLANIQALKDLKCTCPHPLKSDTA